MDKKIPFMFSLNSKKCRAKRKKIERQKGKGVSDAENFLFLQNVKTFK